MQGVCTGFIASPFFLVPPQPSSRCQAPTCTIRVPKTVPMRQISGISEIATAYDAVLLDQFGVIHDGQTPYPAALHAISQLHESGLKIVILSNSSKESRHASEKLRRMNVPVDMVHGIVTSGELAVAAVSDFMSHRREARVLHFNWTSQRGSVGLAKHGISRICPLTSIADGARLPDLHEVDFVLAHGTDGLTTRDGEVSALPLDTLRALCGELGKSKPDTPFFCANPDMVTVDGPKLRTMPGTLALDFERAGGRNVVRLGKPGLLAYEAARRMVSGRMLAIGDSLAHDILGAADAGVDSLYIAGGINAGQFGIPARAGSDGQTRFEVDTRTLESIIGEEAPELGKRRPTYVCDFFRW